MKEVMKEDGELGVSDDKQSLFSTLKSRNSSPNPVVLVHVGHERIKKFLKNKVLKSRTIFIF